MPKASFKKQKNQENNPKLKIERIRKSIARKNKKHEKNIANLKEDNKKRKNKVDELSSQLKNLIAHRSFKELDKDKLKQAIKKIIKYVDDEFGSLFNETEKKIQLMIDNYNEYLKENLEESNNLLQLLYTECKDTRHKNKENFPIVNNLYRSKVYTGQEEKNIFHKSKPEQIYPDKKTTNEN